MWRPVCSFYVTIYNMVLTSVLRSKTETWLGSKKLRPHGEIFLQLVFILLYFFFLPSSLPWVNHFVFRLTRKLIKIMIFRKIEREFGNKKTTTRTVTRLVATKASNSSLPPDWKKNYCSPFCLLSNIESYAKTFI